MKISLEQFTEIVNNHKDFIVNYGKGSNGEDIKELAHWDSDREEYGSETGYWSFKLLYEIVKGGVDDTSIELV